MDTRARDLRLGDQVEQNRIVDVVEMIYMVDDDIVGVTFRDHGSKSFPKNEPLSVIGRE